VALSVMLRYLSVVRGEALQWVLPFVKPVLDTHAFAQHRLNRQPAAACGRGGVHPVLCGAHGLAAVW
jgi:hypothetical protein